MRSSNTQGRSVGQVTYGARDTQGTYDTKNMSWNTDVSHTVGARFAGTGHRELLPAIPRFPWTRSRTRRITTYAVLEGTPNALFPNGVRQVRLIDQAEFNSLVAAGATPAPGQFLASATSFDFRDLVDGHLSVSRTMSDDLRASGHSLSGRLRLGRRAAPERGIRVGAGALRAGSRDPLSRSTGFGLDNNAVFIQQQSAFADRWFVTVGVRVDSKESYDTFVSPKLSVGGFVVPLRQGGLSSLKVFGNIGKGIKSPTFGERFGSGFSDPNPDLKVEEARTGDIGVEATFASQRYRAATTYFNNDYKNQIAFRGGGVVGDGIPENINIDGSEADGWEFETALQRPVRGFTAGGSYSYVDTRVVTSIFTSQQFQPGQPLLRRPRHSGYVRAAYNMGRATVNFDVRMVGERHDNSFLFLRTVPNAAFPSAFTTDITVNPGYAVAGLGLDVRVDRMFSVYIRGNNITDKEYDTVLGYPAMPRQVMVGARFNVGRLR